MAKRRRTDTPDTPVLENYQSSDENGCILKSLLNLDCNDFGAAVTSADNGTIDSLEDVLRNFRALLNSEQERRHDKSIEEVSKRRMEMLKSRICFRCNQESVGGFHKCCCVEASSLQGLALCDKCLDACRRDESIEGKCDACSQPVCESCDPDYNYTSCAAICGSMLCKDCIKSGTHDWKSCIGTRELTCKSCFGVEKSCGRHYEVASGSCEHCENCNEMCERCAEKIEPGGHRASFSCFDDNLDGDY